MFSFWYFVPKSGVAYIFISVLMITIWDQEKSSIDHPYVWIIAAELVMFFICFYIANGESERKRKKWN